MADDAFHEIQLNGKQLVFVFMAVTVVAVVIFLCGVLVGRGVRAARGESDLPIAAGDPTSGATNPVSAPAVAPPSDSNTPSPTSQENLSYYERLDAAQPPPETVKEPTADAAAVTAGAPAESGAATRPSAAASSAPVGSAPSEGNATPSGWAVQVAAVRERGEADAIAGRLSAKGYPTFVMTPPSATSLFRVRVGPFADRREAESIAGRLQKEEQFKPWIVR